MINLGVSDISQVREDSPDILRIEAAKIDLHPDYNFSEPFRGNDLAVVRLARRVEVSHTVSPACFPLSQQEDQILRLPGQTFWTAGLGAIGVSQSPGGRGRVVTSDFYCDKVHSPYHYIMSSYGREREGIVRQSLS